MAGISLQLRALLRTDSYLAGGRAYAYSAILNSGSWIISILSIVVLSLLLHPVIGTDELQLFTTSITYIYAGALILVGPMQLVLTRHAADQICVGDEHEIFPACLAALALVSLLSGLVGFIFFTGFVPGAPLYQISGATLMVYVACIFITSNYLTALQDYRSVVAGFAAGYALSGIGAYWGARLLGPDWALAGFALGHGVLLCLLLLALRREMGGAQGAQPAWDAFRYFVRYPSLVLCGFLYNLGIWIDKLMFWWFSDRSLEISGLLRSATEYDVAIYLSFLSMVPGLAVFFLNIETDFAERYRLFFEAISSRRSLGTISACRQEIVASLRNGFLLLIKVQALTTVTLVIFADRLAAVVGIGSIQEGIFRVTLFGAFLLVCFLSLLTILFYFDDRPGALLCSAAFVLANALLSAVTLLANEAWYGFGFVVASGLATVIAGMRVNQRLGDLEYEIFSAQTD